MNGNEVTIATTAIIIIDDDDNNNEHNAPNDTLGVCKIIIM